MHNPAQSGNRSHKYHGRVAVLSNKIKLRLCDCCQPLLQIMPDFIVAGKLSRLGSTRASATSGFNTIAEEDGSRSEYSHLGSRSDLSQADSRSHNSQNRSSPSHLGSRDNHSHLDSHSFHSKHSDGSSTAAKNKFIRHRRDDYRDAPPTSRHVVTTSDHSQRSAPADLDSPNEVHDFRSYSKWQRYFRNATFLCRPSNYMMHSMNRLITSRLWHLSSFFFTVLLLFGEQVQELWIPKGGDIVFDILFTVAFVFFIIEILLRLYVEPRYFSLDLCGNKGLYSVPTGWCRCRIGSFMFWCDTVSTFTLLYGISYINKRRFAVSTIDIGLDQYGFPVSLW
jgi:hypothetical protein